MSNNTHIIEYRIGRNIDGAPMDDAQWAEFIRMTRDPLEGVALTLQRETTRKLKQWVEVHTGRGEWTDEETGETEPEESAVITLYTDADAQDLDGFQEELEYNAGELAWIFEQDAVALVWQGVSTLVPNRMAEAIADEDELNGVLSTVVSSFLSANS